MRVSAGLPFSRRWLPTRSCTNRPVVPWRFAFPPKEPPYIYRGAKVLRNTHTAAPAGPSGDVADGFRNSRLSGGDDACDPRRMAIGPGRLDQRTARVAVARFGDR